MWSARDRRVVFVFLLPLVAACSGGGPPGVGAGRSEAPPADALAPILEHADQAFREADYHEAQVAYEEALKIDPDHPRAVPALATCYLKTHQVKRSEDLLTAHLARVPDDRAALLVLARTLIREGEFEKAGGPLRTVLQAEPDNLLARYNLGFISYRSRNYDEAVANLQRTIALRPEHPEAHYTLGLTYLALGRAGEAIAELERAAAIDPKHVGARFNLVGAYARAGRMKDAERAQQVYAELSGGSKAQQERDSQIKAQMVEPMQMVNARRYDEALGRYQELVRSYPDYAPLWHQIATMQVRLGRKPEALEALKKAVSLDARLSDSHYLLANVYRDLGDEEAARRELAIFATLETIPEGKSGY